MAFNWLFSSYPSGDTLTNDQVQRLMRGDNLASIDILPETWFREQGYPKFVQPKDMDRNGNFLTFNPTAAYGEVTSVLVLALAVKMSKTPEGMKLLTSIINKYLDNMEKVIASMQHASATSSFTAMMNQYACTNIYERMGLISPLNSQRTKLWLDHIFGVIINKDYFKSIAQGVTTLIQGSNYSTKETEPWGSMESSGAGLGAFAKILGAAAP